MVHIYPLDRNGMHYYFTWHAQIVLWSLVVYFALALYFYHRSCLLAHQNAVTILSVWTLSHWIWLNSPKEFPYSSSLGTKSHDYWHEDAFGPMCLQARSCERPPNTGHRSSTDVKYESLSVHRCWLTASFSRSSTAFFEFTILAWPT